MRKETVYRDFLITFRNGDKKIMQLIRKTSGAATRMKKWKQFSQFRRTSTKVKPIKKPYLSNELRVQEKHKVKEQQSCISIL